MSMVYYFGLVASEMRTPIGYAYGEYGQFGYKVDARRASRAVALRHKNDMLQEGANTSSCRGANSAASLPKLPTAAFPNPPNAPEALPMRPRSKPQQRPYKTHRFRIRRIRQKRYRREKMKRR